jgi:twin arginine-targeting protein translocase, TatA/E family
MFGNIGPWELILILVIVLVIFGPGKLPKIGESLGKAMVSFRKAKEGEQAEKDK